MVLQAVLCLVVRRLAVLLVVLLAVLLVVLRPGVLRAVRFSAVVLPGVNARSRMGKHLG